MSYTKRSVQSASSRLSIVAPGDNPIARVCDVMDVTNVSFLELQTEANNYFRKSQHERIYATPCNMLWALPRGCVTAYHHHFPWRYWTSFCKAREAGRFWHINEHLLIKQITGGLYIEYITRRTRDINVS